MTHASPLLQTLHLVLCVALFWTCFCRQTRTTSTTRADIRFAFWVLSVAAIVAGTAPWANVLWPEVFHHYETSWIDVLLLAAIVLVQAVTAVHWRHGVPYNFQMDAGETMPISSDPTGSAWLDSRTWDR